MCAGPFALAGKAEGLPIRLTPRCVMVSAGAEYQPVVFDGPEVLVLDLPRRGVQVLVGHPDTLPDGPEGPVVQHLFHVVTTTPRLR